MRLTHLGLSSFAIGAGLLCSPLAIAELRKFERVESYRVKEDFEVPLRSGGKKLYRAGDIFWLDAENEATSGVFLRSPFDPKAPAGELHKDDFDSLLERHLPVSSVERDLGTSDGATIRKGAVLIEESFDNDSVWVSIEGDHSGAIYEIPKSDYLARGALTTLKRAPKLVAQASDCEGQCYSLKTPFKGLLPVRSSDPGIDLGAGDKVEVIEEGKGAFAWAKKVKVLSGPSLGKEYYLSGDLLENETAAQPLNLLESADTSSSVSDKIVMKPKPVLVKPLREPTHEEIWGTGSQEHGSQNSSGRRVVSSSLSDSDTINGVALAPVTDPAHCAERRGRDYRSLHSESNRAPYRQAIIRAANEFDVPPAILEASIHLETDYQPSLENISEKKVAIAKYGSEAKAAAALMKAKSDEWGKGLCQFGPSAAAEYDLKWNDPKPTRFPVDAAYKKKYPASVWNPDACLMAKAAYMRRFMERKDLTITLSSGKPYPLHDYIFSRGPDQAARAMLSFFNRGHRLVNSLQAYYSRHGKLPEEYGQAWSTPKCILRTKCRPVQKLSTSVLLGQDINRRHVLNGAGLCGKAGKKSFVGAYSMSYTQNTDGEWGAK